MRDRESVRHTGGRFLPMRFASAISPERPYSGRMMFRVAPEVHASAALAAQLSGKSLNQWAEEALRDAAARVRPKATAN